MKKKEIEKIPFRGGVRADKQYRNAAVAFLQNIREESHLFVEVYENKKRELQTPWIRMVFTQKDWGLYYPDAGVWSAAGLDAKNGKITTAQDNSGRVTTITPGNVSTGHIAAVVGHIGTSRTTVSYIKIVEEFSAGESKDHSSMCINGSFMADGESIKIYNAKHVTSGGHLVFDSDGSTVAYLSSSAKRYKNHLSNMTLDEAEKILDIPVVWFNYKEGYLAEDDQMNGKPVPGMYAEDVAKYYPVGAYNNEEGLVENWNERMIIPAMLKLLQNLYKRIS